ncbi:MAG: hypothetical protein GTN38_00490 [Candidatus Aenigmarchaeota archaeon]|nr:hypothetical protein [Candidatus Aenigmarchaeota archaeon]NIP39982.1 hypothetical protein [Candidatus Aenigmarchaeota archaeon]NIQ17701.1 hypothetical protein [Candidatus Aenigmarchaeota archaeon]NIS72889.1 hypothetical protein [Candidatus Aenigmarchaeota archaeon]
MDKLSRSEGIDLLEEDEETEETQEEEGFEVVYDEEEIESLYRDYRDFREEPETIENQYYLTKRMERKEVEPLDFETRKEYEDPLVFNEKNAYQANDLLKVEYTEPVFFNDQLTYQSVFMENEETGKTVYELTLEASQKNGMDVKISYDERTRTFYLDSMDGKRDGSEIDGNRVYLEFWVKDGETNEYRIGEESMDQEILKRGDKVEWRLATERESYCGGGGYEKSPKEREMEQILLYQNNGNQVRGYVPELGRTLERNPFFYMDFGLNLI